MPLLDVNCSLALCLAPQARTFPRGEGGPPIGGSEEEWRYVGHRKKPVKAL